MAEMLAFLRKAKIAGYAAGSNERSLPDGGKELTFTEGSLEYTDAYYGFNPFTGTEIVRDNGKTVWVMHYTGMSECDSAEETAHLYAFLRDVLSEPDPTLPLRGPAEFVRDGYRYLNMVTGDIDCFAGRETITVNGREAYRLDYNGASV